MATALVYVPEAAKYTEVPLWLSSSMCPEKELNQLGSLKPVVCLAAHLCFLHHPKRRETCIDCLYRALNAFKKSDFNY